VLDAGVATPCLAAARAVIAGDFAAAAGAYERIGSRPDEAACRVLLAEALLAEGEPEPAGAELLAAGAFYAEVGATAELERVDKLLASAGQRVEELGR
jgi:hypothetical protein